MIAFGIFAIYVVVWLCAICIKEAKWLKSFKYSVGDEVELVFNDDTYIGRIRSFEPLNDTIVVSFGEGQHLKICRMSLKKFNERLYNTSTE